MYNEIFENLEKQCSQKELQELKDKTIHLGIFSEPYNIHARRKENN